MKKLRHLPGLSVVTVAVTLCLAGCQANDPEAKGARVSEQAPAEEIASGEAEGLRARLDAQRFKVSQSAVTAGDAVLVEPIKPDQGLRAPVVYLRDSRLADASSYAEIAQRLGSRGHLFVFPRGFDAEKRALFDEVSDGLADLDQLRRGSAAPIVMGQGAAANAALDIAARIADRGLAPTAVVALAPSLSGLRAQLRQVPQTVGILMVVPDAYPHQRLRRLVGTLGKRAESVSIHRLSPELRPTEGNPERIATLFWRPVFRAFDAFGEGSH